MGVLLLTFGDAYPAMAVPYDTGQSLGGPRKHRKRSSKRPETPYVNIHQNTALLQILKVSRPKIVAELELPTQRSALLTVKF